MTGKWFDVTLYGGELEIKETHPPRWQDGLKYVMVKSKWGLFGPQEILGLLVTLGNHGHDIPYIKFGRRKFYKVTPEFLRLARERNAYGRRSSRERAVQDRNERFIEWLENEAL